jgi:hypothetical protein
MIRTKILLLVLSFSPSFLLAQSAVGSYTPTCIEPGWINTNSIPILLV